MSTKYVVLKNQNEEGKSPELWRPVGMIDAASSQAAIKKQLVDTQEPNGEYVAVPARSWDPVKVEAKQAFSFS